MTQSITAKEFAQLRQDGREPALFDVGTLDEFRWMHTPGAVPLPQSQAMAVASSREREGKPIYLISYRGEASEAVAATLERAGIHHVFNVEGGTRAWAACGMPIAQDYTFGEVFRGLLELTLVIAVIVTPIVVPNLLMLPLMAAAGLVLALLAAWDDVGARRQVGPAAARSSA
jgi:rhodanese-related sulfurtransferase